MQTNNIGKYETTGKNIGATVDIKNKQYGDSFNRAGKILEILYPNGVAPGQYADMLTVVRVLDKLFRVANGKQGDENPWFDIAGYGILASNLELHLNSGCKCECQKGDIS